MLTPERRSERARTAARQRHEKELAEYRLQVDPEEVLPEAERDRLALEVRREHMSRLGQRSGKVRSDQAARDRVEASVQRLVAGAPPLTQDQRDRLRLLLGGDAA